MSKIRKSNTTKEKKEGVASVPPGVGTSLKQPFGGGSVRLEFIKPEAKEVFVAGSFNGWEPNRAPLVSVGDGRWVGELSVRPGRYEYLFVADGQWLPDPNAKECAQNPYGGRNSVLTVWP